MGIIKRGLISFKHVHSGVHFLDPHLVTHYSNVRCMIQISGKLDMLSLVCVLVIMPIIMFVVVVALEYVR